MFTLSLLASLLFGGVFGSSIRSSPNIIFFLVDDQDVMLNSLDAMQKTRELFTENGLKFYNGFSVSPVCCVSRSAMLLGRYVHNNLNTNNTESGNCYSDGWIDVEEPQTYNAYLHKAGYKTAYSGKYLNLYGKGGTGSQRTYELIPEGWDDWYTLLGDAKFYNYQLSNNGELEEHSSDYESDYFPLQQKKRAVQFLDEMSSDENSETPFLMVMGTPAAHKPWTPAPEYEYIIDDETMTAPRTLSWNYMDNKDKGVVLNNLDEMDDDLISQSDEIYRRRHAILLSVDDMISEVYSKIEEMGELDNTYFIYTADHGFHVGQYGMTFGKRLLYDTDIRVPFYISGPNVKSGGETSAIALNIDIAPTIIELALGKDNIPDNMDGRSLVEFFDLTDDEENEISNSKQSFVVEYNGEAPPYDMQATGNFGMEPPFLDDIQNIKNKQKRKLLEGEGEGQLEFEPNAESRPQNLWIMNCESQVEGLDGMNCDTWNNTYRCVRVIDGLKDDSLDANSQDMTTWETTMGSIMKGEIYCSYTCFDEGYMEADCEVDSTEALGEYYDLDTDLWQTVNTMDQLSQETKNYYESMLNEHLNCEGSTCRDLRKTTSKYSSDLKPRNANINNIDINKNKHLNYIVVGILLMLGLTIAYVLYSRIMYDIINKQQMKVKYTKVPTQPTYSSFDNTAKPTQAL